MTERPRGSYDVDGREGYALTERIGRMLTGKGGVLLVTLAMLTVGLTTVPTAFAQGMGDRVQDGASDHIPVMKALGGDFSSHTVCRASADGSGILDDDYYLHWSGSCGDVDRDDIRLTQTDGGSAGSVVGSGDSDESRNLDGSMSADLPGETGYLEADGEPGYTAGDWLYFDADNGGSLDASNADIRLTRTDGGSAGTVVSKSSESDIKEAGDGDDDYPISTSLNDVGEFAFKFYDKNGNDRFDPQNEDLFLVKESSFSFAKINDISLSSAGSASFGNQLTESSGLVPGHLLDVSDSTDLVSTQEVTSPRNDRHLFLFFDDADGSEDAVLQDGIILKADSGNYGSRVTSESNGQGEEIGGSDNVDDFTGNVFWLDADSSNDYTPGSDPVYLNRPSTLDGESGSGLSKGDLRLTDIDDFSKGTVVKSDDSDLTAYNSLDPNGNQAGRWFVMLHDKDRTNATELQGLNNGKAIGGDSDWDQNIDGAYISSSNEVSDGDRRLYVSPHLANTEITCSDTGPNHTECDTGSDKDLNQQLQIRSTRSSPSFPGTSPVYFDGNNNSQVDSNDYRIYHPDLAEGSVTSGDEDTGEDLSNVTKLKSTANADETSFTSSSDVYFDKDDSGNVTDGDVRIRMASWPSGSAPTLPSTADCNSDPMDDDCDAPLNSDSRIKVTGADNQYESSQSEYVYDSKDDVVNSADFRFLEFDSGNGAPAGEDVDATDPDVSQLGVDSEDRVYLSWCQGTCNDHPTNRVRVGDIKLGSGATRIDAGSSEYKVELSAFGDTNSDQALKRYDRGESGRITDDGLYLSFRDSTTRLGEDDLRLVPVAGKSAGTHLASGDSEELSSTIQRASGAFESHIAWADIDGMSGYTSDDPVYVDIPTGIYSNGNDDTLSTGDVRLTPVTASDESFSAGTMVTSSDSDRVAYSFDSGGPAWDLYWHDKDRNGELDKGEQIYANPGASTGSVPDILSVRLSGQAASGGTSGGGGGGGGGTTETAPSISITSPNAGAQVDPGATVNIAGNADGGSDSINSVSATVNGESLTVTGTTSWSTSWTTPTGSNGTYTITATVTDTDGETSTATRDVQVGQVGEDSDGDGVLDEEDNCPQTANPDQADLDGDGTGDACDEDTDGDGLYDEQDECPDQQGPIANSGCPEDGNDSETPDTDGDGIPDPSDECPHDEGPRANNGCPEDTNGTDGDGGQEETPAAGLLAVLIAGLAAVAIRRD